MRPFALVLAVLLCVGCGGGGSSQPSPYAGAWNGMAGFVSGSGSGGETTDPSTVLWTVDSRGRVTGTWADAAASGPLAGEVSNGGTLTLTFSHPEGSFSARGVTTIANSGNWQGSLSVTTEGMAGTGVVFEVARQ